MASIPPHYTDRFILQRYNKALHFVQHLPATSNFQPTKSQKLELYALYKQVSEGDINTQRPGLFDVVGRAKWDAWKKLEGISTLEARHIYVEALLRVAAESYKKNVGREEAQQIIHAFAIMKPSGGDDSSDDLVDTDDTSTNQEDNDDSSEASEDAEEKAYLRDIQESTDKITPFSIASDTPTNNLHSNTTTPYGSPDQARKTPTLTRSRLEQHQQQQHQQQARPGSVASIQTMFTAPATPKQLPTYANRPPSVANSLSSSVRPRSAVSSRLGQYGSSTRGNEKKPAHMTRDDLRVLPQKNSYQEPEFIDVNVNPWQHIPTNRPGARQQPQQHESGDSSSSGNESGNDRRGGGSRSRTPNANERYLRKASSSSHLRLPSPMYQQQQKQQTKRPHLTSASPPPHATQQQIHGMTPIHTSGPQFQSPVPGSSASSSVTATPQNHMLSSMSEGRTSRNNNNRHFTFANAEPHIQQQQPHQQISTMALGPATKRALESLQNEVIALNDRIDDLRRDLVERDKQQRVRPNNNQGSGDRDDDSDSSYDMGEGWRWVIKAAVKYAGVNLMTAFILFFILYKTNSPIAFAILKQSSRFWQSFRVRVLISNVVV
ncbi:acyl--binding protein [Mucor ambiguus]|uniref:Acyl--binding protein n=2 Tax=Mucor TaxID=4830 RepID=A0A0C9M3H1_9FUNG|nr:acyl--binding protein [Mucor ambiguus]